MRNKEIFERKLERFEADLKSIGYHIHRGQVDTAYEQVSTLLERLQDLQTLLNTEVQD